MDSGSRRSTNNSSSASAGLHPRVAAALAAGLHPRVAAELVAPSGGRTSLGRISSPFSSAAAHSSLNPQAAPFNLSSNSDSSPSASAGAGGGGRSNQLESARSRLNRMLMNSGSSSAMNASGGHHSPSASGSNPFESHPLISTDTGVGASTAAAASSRPTVNIEDDDTQDSSIDTQDWHLFSTPSESYLLRKREVNMTPSSFGSSMSSSLPLSPTSLGFQESSTLNFTPAMPQVADDDQELSPEEQSHLLMLQLNALENSLSQFAPLDESHSRELVDAMEALSAIHEGIHRVFKNQTGVLPWENGTFHRQDSTDSTSPSYFNFSGTTTSSLLMEEEIASIEAQLQEIHLENESLKLQLLSVPDEL
jgi:hypothetical protein